jgi:formylglycine-generating enzyme required for sulfatase activity
MPATMTSWLTRQVLFGLLLASSACGSAGGKSASGGNSGSSAQSSAGIGSGGAVASGFPCTATADPGELVTIPAGDFTMGCNDAVDNQCSDDEKPKHTVSLSGFSIDRTLVTQAQYTSCINAGACAVPSCDWSCDNSSFPASCMTWQDASNYCAWAGERLPTEAEWEKAARGEQGNKYPWGSKEPDCTLANFAGCGGAAKAVGSLPAGASPYGLFDMAGNVVEFVADVYDAGYYAMSPASDPPGPASGTRHGGRGGGFKSPALYLRTSKRDWYDPTDAGPSLGFRCAK